MNIYEKLSEGRYQFKQQKLKGSGKNEYAGYTYIDLTDILPLITAIEHELKYITMISFTNEQATATVVDVEKPEDTIVFTTPMSTASLKGCHEVQNLGAVETYLRRYLYMAVYEIIEQDELDKAEPKEDPVCAQCGKKIKPYKKMSAHQFAAFTEEKFGEPLCLECGTKVAEQRKAQKADDMTKAIKEESEGK